MGEGTLRRMDIARTLRAARRARKVSQRELATLAGVPRSTIERVEAGRVAPGLVTAARLLGSLGYELVAADQRGEILELDDEHDRVRDRAGRRFPAHLLWGRTAGYFEPLGSGLDWWGWHRIAWPFDGPDIVPAHTFLHRPRDHAAPSEPWRDGERLDAVHE